MQEIPFSGRSVDPKTANALSDILQGRLISPGDEEYDEARKIFNGMIDKRPALIAQCIDAADVIACVNFARENSIPLSIRGGGHGVAGKAICDGCLEIDLSTMRRVTVDPEARRAVAEPGARWKDLDHATQAHGLATTGGLISSTGIAGLTLGGGAGWLMGRFGLACDNLISAEVVTADGQAIKASNAENTDLFWALKGGSGNFGVVTSFEYELHPVSNTLAGLILWPRSKAPELMRYFREYVRDLPDELGILLGLITGPDGQPYIGTVVCWTGEIEQGKMALEPLRSFGPPAMDNVGVVAYEQVQQMLDPTVPWGSRNYWKSGFMADLSDDSIDIIIRHAENMPSPLSAVHIWCHHGEVNRIPETATAFPNRSFPFNLHILGMWQDAGQDEAGIRWAKEFWNDIKSNLADRVYVNFMNEQETDRTRSAYGPNYERLSQIKSRYDPQNLFRVNQNIKPSQ